MKPRLTKTLFDRFQAFILKESGLDFKNHHRNTLEEKCVERMRILKLGTFEEFLNFLMFTREGVHEFKSLLDLLTVGETYFFRNKAQFDGVREYVIPGLKKIKPAKLRIWCAGCSTGEEPYTLAMVLREAAPYLPFSIIATDINRRSLNAARAGVYSERSVRNVEPDLLKKYFENRDGNYILTEEIKSYVNFAYHNLAGSDFSHAEMQDLHMLLCRNVTIYFDKKTLRRVTGKFVSCLSPGGFLFIGHAETLRGISDAFHVVQIPDTIIYKKNIQVTPPVKDAPIFSPPEKDKKKEGRFNHPESVRDDKAEEGLIDKARSALIKKRYSDALVFVDRHLSKLPKDFTGLMLKGEILGNQRVFKEALNFIDRAIDSDKLSTSAYCLKGTLLADMGKYREAVSQFKRALYLEPDDCISHYHLGNMYRILGDPGKAAREYKSCDLLLQNVDGNVSLPFADGIRAVHLHKTIVNVLKELKPDG